MATGFASLINSLGTDLVPGLFAAFATDEINVLREARTDRGGGTTSVARSVVNSAPLPCLWEPDRFRKQIAADKWEALSGYKIYLVGGVDVIATDQLEMLPRDSTQPPRTFSIEAISDVLGVLLEISVLLPNLPDGDQS